MQQANLAQEIATCVTMKLLGVEEAHCHEDSEVIFVSSQREKLHVYSSCCSYLAIQCYFFCLSRLCKYRL